jgi:hypothetical protein
MGRPITPIPRKATFVAVEDSYVFVLILAMIRKDSVRRGENKVKYAFPAGPGPPWNTPRSA